MCRILFHEFFVELLSIYVVYSCIWSTEMRSYYTQVPSPIAARQIFVVDRSLADASFCRQPPWKNKATGLSKACEYDSKITNTKNTQSKTKTKIERSWLREAWRHSRKQCTPIHGNGRFRFVRHCVLVCCPTSRRNKSSNFSPENKWSARRPIWITQSYKSHAARVSYSVLEFRKIKSHKLP